MGLELEHDTHRKYTRALTRNDYIRVCCCFRREGAEAIPVIEGAKDHEPGSRNLETEPTRMGLCLRRGYPVRGFATLVALVSWIAAAALGQGKHPSKITFRVVDDLGTTVSEGEVRVSTLSHWVPGEGFGRDEYENFSTALSAEGLASLTVPNLRGRLAYGVYPNGKHYPVTMQSYQFDQVQGGRWEPWNPEVTVTVPRKINPIPLFVRLVGNGPSLEMPMVGPVGFDLLMSDWVAPYGKGKRADFVFERKTIVPTIDPTQAFESVFNHDLFECGRRHTVSAGLSQEAAA